MGEMAEREFENSIDEIVQHELHPEAEVGDVRQARCAYDKGQGCGGNRHQLSRRDSRVDSKPTLPFFAAKPDKAYDEYYCGCWGWD